jgi:hypothetical protein
MRLQNFVNDGAVRQWCASHHPDVVARLDRAIQ